MRFHSWPRRERMSGGGRRGVQRSACIVYLRADDRHFGVLVDVDQQRRGTGIDHVQAERDAQQRYQHQKRFGRLLVVVRLRRLGRPYLRDQHLRGRRREHEFKKTKTFIRRDIMSRRTHKSVLENQSSRPWRARDFATPSESDGS